MKRTIALDLDGVMFDMHGRMVELLGENWEQKPKNLFWEAVGNDKNFFANLKLYDHALDLLEMISHHDVYILTAIPRPEKK
jgi:5'(3')-deoxyribonucleotidase